MVDYSHIPRIHTFESEKVNVPKKDQHVEDKDSLSSFCAIGRGVLPALSLEQPTQPLPILLNPRKKHCRLVDTKLPYNSGCFLLKPVLRCSL